MTRIQRILHKEGHDMSLHPCTISGCNKHSRSLKYCEMHRARVKRHGDPEYCERDRHGMSDTAEYKIWEAMIQRCTNSKDKGYHNYGGRGISVCDAWRSSFTAFIRDMNARPSRAYSLDRIDNDGGYEPSNCRWATRTQQVLNRRMNKNNTSGHVGVHFSNAHDRWIASIKHQYKYIHLGVFGTRADAIKAREAGELKYRKGVL